MPDTRTDPDVRKVYGVRLNDAELAAVDAAVAASGTTRGTWLRTVALQAAQAPSSAPAPQGRTGPARPTGAARRAVVADTGGPAVRSYPPAPREVGLSPGPTSMDCPNCGAQTVRSKVTSLRACQACEWRGR